MSCDPDDLPTLAYDGFRISGTKNSLLGRLRAIALRSKRCSND